MHTDIQDKALREAGHHLAKAIQALQDAGYSRLGLDAYDVLNAVLRTRQALPRVVVTVVPAAELRTRPVTSVEVR